MGNTPDATPATPTVRRNPRRSICDIGAERGCFVFWLLAGHRASRINRIAATETCAPRSTHRSSSIAYLDKAMSPTFARVTRGGCRRTSVWSCSTFLLRREEQDLVDIHTLGRYFPIRSVLTVDLDGLQHAACHSSHVAGLAGRACELDAMLADKRSGRSLITGCTVRSRYKCTHDDAAALGVKFDMNL
jgi:hypothetical protein